jgi:hypothetical protein
MEIRTARLVLRSWRESDIVPFAAFCADPAGDFEHPDMAPGHALRPHVLYRVAAIG